MSLQAIQAGVTPASTERPFEPLGVPARRTVDVLNTDAMGRALFDYTDRYCTLRVIGAEGFEGEIDYLLLQSCSELYVDRLSPVYTFGAAALSSSGEDAKQFVYAGCLLPNKSDGDVLSRFRDQYEYLLRASALITTNKNIVIELTYRDQVRRGYMTSLAIQLDSEIPNKINVTFSLFVIDQFSLL